MGDFSNIEESDLRALLRGQVTPDDARLGNVAAFLADLEVVLPQSPTAHYEARHLSAVFEQARLLAEKGEPAVMPGSKADGPDDQVSGLPKPRRNKMLEKFKRSPLFGKLKGLSLSAKLAAVTMAFMVVFSSMAFAGALPGPVQDATADALSAAGIDLPGGTDQPLAPAEAEVGDADEAADEADDADDVEVEAEDADDADEAEDADDADDADEAEDADDADDADEAEDADDADDAVDVDDSDDEAGSED